MKYGNNILSLIVIATIITITVKLFNIFTSLLISGSLLILYFIKEKKKQEKYNQIIKERQIHIENLKKSGLKNLNLQQKIYTKNIATNINIFQGDKIMVSFLVGKLIFYSIDIMHYQFIELLCIDELNYNIHNSIELEYGNNLVLVYGNFGIKIFDIKIKNLKGKEGNKYIIKQKLNMNKFNNEIIKVIELDKNTLVSISIDYLLIWYKIKDEYILSKKFLDYNKYENLLILSNLLKLDSNNIVLLKLANSNMTKSTIDFIEIINHEPNEIKLLNIDISNSELGNNNLLLINQKEKIFLVGCMKGLAVISGKYMELIQFISTGEKIKYIELFFNKYIFFNYKEQNKENEYIFYQIEFNYDFEKSEKIILKNNSIKEDLRTIKYFKDGLVIIGDREGYLQLWH